VTDLAILPQLGLLLVRPGMVVAVSPGIGGVFVPTPVKIGLTLLVALGLLPSVAVPESVAAGALVTMVAREVAIGLSLGFALRALIGGAELAGHLSGFQMGFSYAATIDPASGVRNSVVSSLFGMLALLAILGVDGHHAIFRALASSYAGLPIGTGGVDPSLLTSVREMLALVFVVGARLAAPIVVVLVIVELAFGLIARSAPSLNVMSVGYPARLLVGLFILGLVVAAVPRVVVGVLGRTVEIAIHTALAFR
jgi:flagellar biosynthetic protein FliR